MNLVENIEVSDKLLCTMLPLLICSPLYTLYVEAKDTRLYELVNVFFLSC